MKKTLPILLLNFLILFFCPSSHCQIAEKTFHEQQQYLRSQQEAEERERRLSEPDVELHSTPEKQTERKKTTALNKQMPGGETPCFIINQFLFEIPFAASLPPHILAQSGTTRRRDAFYFLNKEIAFARGKCIGLKGIKFLIDTLLSGLMARGYVTTRIGIVPEQNLTEGVLKFSLLPGYIRNFRFADGVSTSITTAFPARPGDLLNLRSLEQGMEQLKRVSSFTVAVQLEPGDAPGETDVVLTLKKHKPWQLSLSLDNSGNTTTGWLQAGVLANLDNMLGINDVLSINATHDADGEFGQHGSRSLSTWYTLPFGNWNFSLNASHYQSYYRRPNATRWPFLYTERQTLDAKIAWMFWRDQVQKNSIEFHAGRYWSQASLGNRHWAISGDEKPLQHNKDGIWLANQHRNMTFAELSYLYRRHFGSARLHVTASYRWGVPWLGADSAGWPPSQQYHLKILDATLYVPVMAGKQLLHYTTTVRGQLTGTEQDGTNYFSIGSRWTVRGFDYRSSLAADQGWFLRNELQIPLGRSRHFLYYGLDAGSVFAVNQSINTRKTLAGAASGLRGTLFSRLSYDLFAAVPLYYPDELDANPIVGFNIRQFF